MRFHNVSRKRILDFKGVQGMPFIRNIQNK